MAREFETPAFNASTDCTYSMCGVRECNCQVEVRCLQPLQFDEEFW